MPMSDSQRAWRSHPFSYCCFSRNGLITSCRRNETYLNTVSQAMWCNVLSPFPMAIGLRWVFCFRETEGCRVSIYCPTRGASQKTFRARWVRIAIEKRRSHTIRRPILLAISALLNLFFPNHVSNVKWPRPYASLEQEQLVIPTTA